MNNKRKMKKKTSENKENGVDVCVCEDMMKIYTALKENEILPFGAT
jgi:predicted peroxiredoxin